MWKDLGVKFVNWNTFCILDEYPRAGVDALRRVKFPSEASTQKKSQKLSSEWRIVDPGSIGSSPSLKFGSEMADFSSLTMDFKGFHADSSVESTLKLSGITNQTNVEDQRFRCCLLKLRRKRDAMKKWF